MQHNRASAIPHPTRAEITAGVLAALRHGLRRASRAVLPAVLLAALVLAGRPALAESATPQPGAPTADQAQQILEVLQDPARRAAFIATLQGLVHTLPQTAAAGTTAAAPAQAAPAATPAAAATLALAPDSLGAQVISHTTTTLSALIDQFVATAKALLDVPLLWGWLRFQFTDPIARAQMLELSWKLAVVLIAAGAAAGLAYRALQRVLKVLEEMAERHLVTPEDEALPQGDDDHEVTAPPLAEAPVAVTPGGAGKVTLPSLLPAAQTATGQTVAAEVAEPAADSLPPPLAAANARASDSGTSPRPPRRHPALAMLRRLPFILAAAGIYLLPVVAFAAVGNLLVAAGLGSIGIARLVIHAILNSVTIAIVVLVGVRLLVAPQAPALRLLQVSEETARFATSWARWLTGVALVGLTLVQIAGFLGMYTGAREALMKGVTLVLHIMVGIVVIEMRGKVAAKLRAPAGQTGAVAALRNRLAAVWHIIALFYILATWLVLALEIQDGLARLVRFALVTTVVLGAFRLLAILLLAGLERLFRPAGAGRHPSPLHLRLLRYHRLTRLAALAAVNALAVLVLLEAWGLPALEWFTSGALGGQVVSAVASAGITVVIALLIWEASNTGLQQHISRLERDADLARSARLRTLMPILRTTLLVTILVVVTLSVLSDVGVNTGPLLAGAGIVGVAIGFGSQKLVQDFITGLFLLMENAMQVGDWVTAAGLSGSVETLSIRTMRLRAGDGSVHIVPFSSVTTVTNTNRGLGNAAVSVDVPYKEDTDRVAEALKQIARGMREEADFQGAMLSELQLWGVDRVEGGLVTITGQIVCTASGRWAVQREFNRRMKKTFEELGIEIYNPNTKIQLEQVIVPPPLPPQAALSPVPPQAALSPVPPQAALSPVPPQAALSPVPPQAALSPVPPQAALSQVPPQGAPSQVPPQAATAQAQPLGATPLPARGDARRQEGEAPLRDRAGAARG